MRHSTTEYNRRWRKRHPKLVVLERARARARDYDLEYDLTPDDIEIPEVCPVLGIPLVFQNGRLANGSPSLDRIDTSKGYIKGNVIVVSQQANAIKNRQSIENLRSFADEYERKASNARKVADFYERYLA